MICGYSNIYDLCSNKYTYEYATFSVENNTIVANTGYSGSVYRTDKNTKEKILLEASSSLNIPNCDLNEENSELIAWECYLWYKNSGGFIDNPPLEDYQIAQIEHINNTYENLLDNGILISIDNFATNISVSVDGAYAGTTVSESVNFKIILPAKKDDIINFSNILSLATLLNANDDFTPLPPLVDIYNNAHFLNYYNLTNILSNYFNKLKTYKLIKDDLIDKVINSSTIDDVVKQSFYTNYSTLNYSKQTNNSASNDITVKFSNLTCEEINKLCDPPCDPDSCESCVDGVCESLCSENECCNNGVCGACGCWVCGEDDICGQINLPYTSPSISIVYSICTGNIPNDFGEYPNGNLYTSEYDCCLECEAWRGPGGCSP
jgi:hypothetical protein